jgi:hypothetical protein
MSRRVVVTGMGCISPVGNNVKNVGFDTGEVWCVMIPSST